MGCSKSQIAEHDQHVPLASTSTASSAPSSPPKEASMPSREPAAAAAPPDKPVTSGVKGPPPLPPSYMDLWKQQNGGAQPDPGRGPPAMAELDAGRASLGPRDAAVFQNDSHQLVGAERLALHSPANVAAPEAVLGGATIFGVGEISKPRQSIAVGKKSWVDSSLDEHTRIGSTPERGAQEGSSRASVKKRRTRKSCLEESQERSDRIHKQVSFEEDKLAEKLPPVLEDATTKRSAKKKKHAGVSGPVRNRKPRPPSQIEVALPDEQEIAASRISVTPCSINVTGPDMLQDFPASPRGALAVPSPRQSARLSVSDEQALDLTQSMNSVNSITSELDLSGARQSTAFAPMAKMDLSGARESMCQSESPTQSIDLTSLGQPKQAANLDVSSRVSSADTDMPQSFISAGESFNFPQSFNSRVSCAPALPVRCSLDLTGASKTNGNTLQIAGASPPTNSRGSCMMQLPRASCMPRVMSVADAAAIVVDCGSHTTKAGLAGEMKPRLVFPSVARTGRKSLVKAGDAMELIFKRIFEELGEGATQKPILLTEPPETDINQREFITQILFETFDVPAICITSPALLAMTSTGREVGLIVDIGDSATNIVPVYGGYPVTASMGTMDVGGRNLTEYMQELLNEKGSLGNLPRVKQRDVCTDIKETLLNVMVDCTPGVTSFEADSWTGPTQSYTLPDGEVIVLGVEPVQCAEALFQPEAILGVEERSITQCAFDTVMGSEANMQQQLFQNIILVGGTSLIPGLQERLLRELTALAPASQVNIEALDGRQHAAWQGGAIMATLDWFKASLYTKEEYEECGPQGIHAHCY